jgi:hypothetical protein
MPADIYEFEGSGQQSEPLAELPQPAANRKTKETRVSGLYGLSSLPLWGLNVYRGLIVALLVAAVVVGGVPKFALAMGGLFLCVGPFVASGFTYRYCVAFRDGPITGLLYMLFLPYRIHYRLTHRELFEKLRMPSLTLRDFSLLVLGLCFLPAVILGAQEMDKRGRNPAPAVDWARFARRPGELIPPPPAAERKRIAKPPILGFRTRPTRPDTLHRPVSGDVTDAGANALRPSPAKANVPSPPLADVATEAAQPASNEPNVGRPARFGHRTHPPFPPHPSVRPDSAPFGPEATVTITVHGAVDSETKQRFNDAIIAIVKSAGGNWRVSHSNIGDSTMFTVGPVTDVKSFADKIDFGKVTRVEGRSIDVEPGP